MAALGEFTDPTFGTTQSDFMAQLYCARNFKLPDDVTHIDSANIYLFYRSWFGDSSEVHQVNVYELNNSLDLNKPYYSKTDVSKYCDRSKLIAQGTFTTGDFYTSDSVRALKTYYPLREDSGFA